MQKKLILHTSTALIPTSITTAPGFSQSPLTNSAFPAAATKMSASLVISAGFGVCECTTVTVAFSRCRSKVGELTHGKLI